MEIGEWIKREDVRSELSQIAFDLGYWRIYSAYSIKDAAIFILYAENIFQEDLKFSQYQSQEKIIEKSLRQEIGTGICYSHGLRTLDQKRISRYFMCVEY